MTKYGVAGLLLCLLLGGCAVKPIVWHRSPETSAAPDSGVSSGGQTAVQALPDPIRAVWISYLELEPILKNKSEAAFTDAFSEMMQNVSAFGLNTVIVQVRPFSDALYPSELYPPTALYGARPASYDPLAIMLRLAHAQGLSFHAWVNPLRGQTVAQIKAVSKDYLIRRLYDRRAKSDRLSVLGGRLYLNPAYPQVRRMIADGAAEIVRRYPVDAVHIDDYFYPTTDRAFDKKAYARYGKKRTLADFRRDNCSALVREMYAAVKRENPQVAFGISPQGSLKNNLDSQYADVKTWCTQSGYADYMMPQLYYGFQNEAAPFVQTAQTWAKLTRGGTVRLAAGLACHKMDLAVDAYAGSGKYEWTQDKSVIRRQISYVNGKNGYSGFALFSYQSVFSATARQKAQLRSAIGEKP